MTSIIIPYRDRAEHLAILVPRLAELLPDAEVLVIEQGDIKPFNRGKLLNVGAKYAKGDILIMHDVDMIPRREYPVPIINGVTQVASSSIQQRDYLGGVTIYPISIFKHVGGYHNDYFHRAEDNEMRFNLRAKGVPVYDRWIPFKILNHVRPVVEFDPVLWKKAQEPRVVQNQLGSCEYIVTSITRHDFYNKITVNL